MDFFGDRAQLRHKTLILPALSIGNAGQLGVDLLISSYRVSRIGYLDEPFVLPCVGNDPFGPKAEGKLSIALELYADPIMDITILQQRSPLVKGATWKFAANLAEWAKSEGFEQIIILSGLDSGKRQLHYDTGPQIYYFSQDGTHDVCERLGWKNIERPTRHTEHNFDFALLKDAISEPNEHDENYIAKLPVTALFSACKEKGLRVLSVLCYCAEGDNIPDAFLLATACDKFLHSSSEGDERKNWKIPLSWSSVYGGPPDMSIY